ncbi:glucose PTS transporter transcription antiterminator GlcT [Tuberibacillus sp. Marseille-P3662]|uniref:glucose PTS transporter transcription antiterminator GlcT n=1 Tax=Tuberibacillus sp. Marseille-P3662 TaxID=1965358 RepID=UPI000A1CC08B|nr:transcription antiterminator [Tuberibacillus sp. Marseille-P3662]
MAIHYEITKILNNNVLIADRGDDDEVVLIGKGLGFGKKAGQAIATDHIEKVFVLESPDEQEQYKQIIANVDEPLIALMHDIIDDIETMSGSSLNEHIHVALTDHIAFAVKRLQQGLPITNPFLHETKALYPDEYKIARHVTSMIEMRLGLNLPEGETGFIALHIHSALTETNLQELNRYSQLISRLLQIVEDELGIAIDTNSTHYLRFIRHLRYTLERVKKGEQLHESDLMKNLLKAQYPLCYNLAWKMIKIMQQELHQTIDEAEAVYLTLHLQRFTTKNE